MWAMRAELEAVKAGKGNVAQSKNTCQQLPLGQDDNSDDSDSNSECVSDSETGGKCDVTLDSDCPVRSGGL